MGFEIQTRNIVYPPHPRVPQWAGNVPWSPAIGAEGGWGGGGGAIWEGGNTVEPWYKDMPREQ